MANRFWVGGGSANTWAATGNTNWAATSGGANNQSVPGTGDVAIFDSNSGVGNSVISANITVQGLDCTGGTGNYVGTITHNANVTLTINTGAASSIRFSSGMTYTPAAVSSIITLTHTTGTANITSSAKKLFALTINGAGGTTQLLDDLLVNFGQNAALIITAGVFDANTHAFTANLVSSSNSNVRSIILGSAVTIGGNISNNNTVWLLTTTTNLTFTKNSANIEVLAPTSAIQSVPFAGGGLTYNDLTLDSSTNEAYFSISGANTFSHLVVNPGWNMELAAVTTVISNAFTWTGTQANPILVQCSSLSQQATLSVASGACSLAWGGLGGIIASGGATFTATNVFNFGSNSGWAITPPLDVAGVNVAQIAGSTSAAANLSKGTNAVPRGTATTGASTTSIPTSALSLAGSAATGIVSNQFVGRTIVFDDDTTTAGLRGAASTISASSASNTPAFTVVTLPATPASGDTFGIY